MIREYVRAVLRMSLLPNETVTRTSPIDQEAVKHMKEIAKKEGYLLVFDANTTVISADRINISSIVVDKLNKSLPKITVEKKKENKVD